MRVRITMADIYIDSEWIHGEYLTILGAQILRMVTQLSLREFFPMVELFEHPTLLPDIFRVDFHL